MTSEEKETAVDVFDMKIQQLNFSARTHNCLRRAGVNTLGDLCRLSEGELKNGRDGTRVPSFLQGKNLIKLDIQNRVTSSHVKNDFLKKGLF